MRKLQLRPDANGYSMQEASDEILSVRLAGGLSRTRVDKIGGAQTVSLQWTLNPVQHQYWRAFFVTETKKGALPFLCDLVSDTGAGPVEHVCKFVPGTVGLPTQQGFVYVQAATLEVKPVNHDPVMDEAIMDLWDEFGSDPSPFFNRFDRLANIVMPETLSA